MGPEISTSIGTLKKGAKLTQKTVDKVIRVFRFFMMSEEETYLAGIDRGNYSERDSHYRQEYLFNSSETKKNH